MGGVGKSPEELAPITFESITVFPHGLTGELPFISLRFVEEREGKNATEAEQEQSTALPSGAVAVARVHADVDRKSGTEGEHKEEPADTIGSVAGGNGRPRLLVVHKDPLPLAEAAPER